MIRRTIFLSTLALLLASAVQAQNKRDLAVREDKQKLADDESWFYDDLDTARLAAAEAKRPLMIVFR
jgi:hypothetical protein